jgi:hypothetical protein
MRGRSTNTAYQFLRNSADLQRAVDMLPGDSVDILVTHGPPRVGDYGKLSHGDSMLRYIQRKYYICLNTSKFGPDPIVRVFACASLRTEIK